MKPKSKDVSKQHSGASEYIRCTTRWQRRIDFQVRLDNYVVAIEVDEFQHKRYDFEDEEKRILQIYEDADCKLVLYKDIFNIFYLGLILIHLKLMGLNKIFLLNIDMKN